MAFSKCSPSEVTDFAPKTGNADESIVISGSGFGTDASCIMVTIGTHTCDVTALTDTEITCDLDPADDMFPGQVNTLQVMKGDLGYATDLIVDNSYVLVPKVGSVSPVEGSVEGGTLVTLSGSGFYNQADELTVTFDLVNVEMVSSTYTEVVVRTRARPTGVTSDIAVTISGFAATCVSCSFSYTDTATPQVTAIAPDTVTGATTLTITGTGLGNTVTGMTVEVGETDCAPQTATDTEVTCDLPYAEVGAHNPVITIPGAGYPGYPSGVTPVTGQAGVSAVTPSTGSIHGGTHLTITGHGFITTSTIADIDGAPCTVSSVTVVEVVCTTTAHAAGTVAVEVVSGGVNFPTVTYEYSSASTPTITSISPTSGAGGDVITVSGTGFTGGESCSN